jgi:UDP-N-acetyl-D-mannosaminuronic acid dehydrogenase
MKFETLSVIGLGYIGLPTAATFASRGLKVIGVDVNPKAVEIINSGGIHIIEPDLDILVHSVVQTGNLRATLTPEPADAFIIAVPTPFKEDKQPDLKYIEAACKAIAPVLQKGNLVILESTSPVGATEQMAQWLAEARQDLTFPQTAGEESDIRIAHCPERVLPGKVLVELINNDRVIGGMTAACSEAAVTLYKLFVQGECVVTNARTAEMCKLTENSFRDVNIAFANELSMICDKLDINVWELIKLANRHPRVSILQPGPGVGGHCIAVDPWFIVASAPEEAKIISTARQVNDSKPDWVIQKIEQEIKRYLADQRGKRREVPVIACLGLAFKSGIDDLRESPALDICRMLAGKKQFTVIAVEPNISTLPCEEDFELVALDHALKHADIFVLLVDHSEFRKVKPDCSYIVDTRGIWSN